MQVPRRRSDALRKIDDEPIYLTPQGIERLRDKLARLKKALPELAAEAARTAAYGDRSDNAEYKQAKGALRYTHREIWRLEDELKRVVAITRDPNVPHTTVQLGSLVVVKIKDRPEATFEILGSQETDPGKGRISNKSPLGAALMNRAKGEIVVIQTANGPQEYRILDIR